MDLLQSLSELLAPSANAGPAGPPVPDPEAPRGLDKFTQMMQAVSSVPQKQPFGGIGLGANALPTPSGVPSSSVPGISLTAPMPQPAANSGGLIDEIRRAFEGGPAIAEGIPAAAIQPRPAPPAPPAAAPRVMSAGPATGAQAQAAPGGINMQNIGEFLRHLSRGAAMADPRAPKGTAFAQGLSGNLQGKYTEEQQRQQAAEKRGDKQFDQRLATNKDVREQNADQRATKTAGISNQTGELTNAKMVQELMRTSSGSFNTADKLKIEAAISARLRAENPVGLVTGQELTKMGERIRKEVMQQLQSGQQGVDGPAGDGTQQAPAKPRAKADFDALPPGSYFVNPADGRVLQKK